MRAPAGYGGARARRAILTAAAVAWLSPLTAPAQTPQRILSMNVCTDQLLLTLVPRERIVALSYLAADERTSGIAGQINGIELVHGIAEEIVALEPDLVVTGQYSLRPTVGMLRRIGLPVLELPMADTLTAVEVNLRTLGAAVGADERAADLIAEFHLRLDRLTVRDARRRPLFVNYDANGWTTGQTGLLADIAHRAGLSTPGDRLGFSAASRLSLEALLLLRPALVDLGYAWDDPPALASEQRRHPVVETVMKRARAVEIPDSAWLCGSPHSLVALERLREARDAALRDRESPQS